MGSEWTVCPACHGSSRQRHPLFFMGIRERDCRLCQGTGRIKEEERFCKECGGTGKIRKKVRVPATADRDAYEGYKDVDCPACMGKGRIKTGVFHLS